MNIRPQVLGCFCPLDESLSSAYSLSFSTCQLSVGSWFVWEIALSISAQLGIRSCQLIQPALINKTSDCFAPWNRAQRYQPGIWGGRGKTTTPSFFHFAHVCSSSRLLQSLDQKKYDVPLFSVSYCDSYSKRAVVWRIELNIILQYIKITYWIKHEVAIR